MKKGAKIKKPADARDERIHPALVGKVPEELLDQSREEGHYVSNRYARTFCFLDGRRITEKRAKQILGKEGYAHALATARFLHYQNSDESFSESVPQGILTISFKYI